MEVTSARRTAIVVLFMIPVTYLALLLFGDADTATAATPAFVAVAALVALPRHLRTPPPEPVPARAPRGTLVLVPQRTLVIRGVALALGLVLVESVVSSVIGGMSSRPAVHDGLNTMLGLPIGMYIAFRLGRWSARWLPVKDSLLWLAVIAGASRIVRLLLYGATGQQSVHGFGYMVIRNVLLGVVILLFLVLGNLHARRRPLT